MPLIFKVLKIRGKRCQPICAAVWQLSFLLWLRHAPAGYAPHMHTFILHDEKQVNSYGFRIKTDGIKLTRFQANPVMLADHYNSTSAVLGRWDDITIVGGQVQARANFDTEDADAQKVAGKVERGYLRGCSIGISFDRKDMQLQPDGTYVLEACELVEASICAVPSNAAAVRLYAADKPGQPLAQSEVATLLAEATIHISKPPTNTMTKINLSVAALTALALATDFNEEQLAPAIERLATENAGLKQKLKEATDKLLADQEAKAKTLVADAVLAGKLTADTSAAFEEMALKNYDLAAKIIGAMPGKTSLAAMVTGGGKPAEVKSLDDFEKLPLEKQLEFKTTNPDGYKALFA